MKFIFFLMPVFVFSTTMLFAQKSKSYQLTSPDGKTRIKVETGANISWSVVHENTVVLAPSAISLMLADGEVLGKNVAVSNAKTSAVNTAFETPVYKKSSVTDHYNQLIIKCKGNYGIVFRTYDDGVAYRFFTARKDSLTIVSEQAEFNFDKDYKAFIPYVRDLLVPGDKFINSFEALYDEIKISEFARDTLAFLPLLVELDKGKKAAIVEADLESYPRMFININQKTSNGLQGVFAPYPIGERTGGYNNINFVVSQRANYIAITSGARSFPWRAIIISTNDKELANNDMVFA